MRGVRPQLTHEARVTAFWANTIQVGECWEWTASRDRTGYGRTKLFYRAEAAHRAAYRLEYGEIPDGLVIDHICHNRPCVRPKHLRAVTQKQNVENHIGAQSNNRSAGVRGVSWCPDTRKWRAGVQHLGKTYYLGRYSTIREAGEVARAKRLELFTCNDLDRITS